MAEIQVNPKRGGRSKTNLRIDLTPMVDLGFLLITFFMMTTSMSKPKAMDIQMPYTPAPPNATIWYESSAITLLPAAGHKVFYYEGIYDPLKKLNVAGSMQEVRNVLMKKQQSITHRTNADERFLQVLIKPHATSTTEDIIGLFDEMNILQIKYFAMVDIYPTENDMVERLQGK